MSPISRRHLLGAAAGLAAIATVPPRALAQGGGAAPAAAPAAPTGPFKLPSLGYAYNALEPHIDARTMEIHYTRHHQAYVNSLNNFAKDNPQIAEKPMTEVLANLNAVPEAIRTGVRNNMGGHANHTMFWEIMSPSGGKPSSDVLTAIDRDLGGVDKMKSDVNAKGLGVFGSGWVFVTVDKDGKLAIEARPNQDTPIMDGKRALFGNDVWEHAYYLNYQNRRADYLNAWWNTVNWTKITERYAAAKAGTLGV
ncbi:superoxide dismutase [Bradyrhizobium sp. LHD-71]|uniref:superoxide dismutase n=1 Tax=Bradyrhizobium sp. LHD-71 TaxID=3072141 RepID=UPI00280F2455|nr:superoxide dismutase [Bradyrhizobium sp. LHD-71]MDQ8731945.1 superoxide dismutase [Bradyrhizobium sp. LHD-71]